MLPQQISRIQFTDRTITDASTVKQIIDTLDHLQAFSPNHEAEPAEPMFITLRSGQTHYLRIKYRQTSTTEGVVIVFASDSSYPIMGFQRGYAFSEPLLPVLRELGILSQHPEAQ